MKIVHVFLQFLAKLLVEHVLSSPRSSCPLKPPPPHASPSFSLQRRRQVEAACLANHQAREAAHDQGNSLTVLYPKSVAKFSQSRPRGTAVGKEGESTAGAAEGGLQGAAHCAGGA